MASPEQVKQYLAYWFQIGKRIVIGGKDYMLPQPVMQQDRYSDSFETCWQRIMNVGAENCNLDGMPQSIGELLSSRWEIAPCARCDMPVPMISLGIQPLVCPCNDVPNWPNTELPQPRSPVNGDARLGSIRDRLTKMTHSAHSSRKEQPGYEESKPEQSKQGQDSSQSANS